MATLFGVTVFSAKDLPANELPAEKIRMTKTILHVRFIIRLIHLRLDPRENVRRLLYGCKDRFRE